MLTPVETGTFLSHESPWARDQALLSLSNAPRHAEPSIQHALSALESYRENAFAFADRISLLTGGEDSIKRLFPAAGRPVVRQWLQTFTPATVLKHAGLLHESLAPLVARLRELADQSDEVLWQEALASADPLVLWTLRDREPFVAGRVEQVLRRKNDPEEKLAIEMAGRCALGMEAERLIDRLVAGTEVDRSTLALGAIGGAGVVTQLEQASMREGAAFRRATARVLAMIRVPSMEGTLQRLLVQEDDPEARWRLCVAMADACATTGFDAACSAARLPDDGFPELAADARLGLARLSIMLGRPLPERDLWLGQRKVVRSDWLFIADPRARRQDASSHTLKSDGFIEEGSPFALDQDDGETEPAGHSVVRTAGTPLRVKEKTGRNETCPCGSGKKYKKCCGR